MSPDVSTKADPWAQWRSVTTARIGLQRAGRALATAPMLEFQVCHARARDAIHAPFDAAGITAALAPTETIEVSSKAADRTVYLRRPDLGRMLDSVAKDRLPRGPFDIVFIVADGLSAAAASRHATQVVSHLLPLLTGLSVGPVVLATGARVALADEIGERMNARFSLILIGERPGLSTPDSLGLYLTAGPRVGLRDADRNCISNVHLRGGLTHRAAAEKTAWLVRAAQNLGRTGVDLKEDQSARLDDRRGVFISRSSNALQGSTCE